MELVDMRDLGSRVARRVGSSPFIRTMRSGIMGSEDFIIPLRFLSGDFLIGVA